MKNEHYITAGFMILIVLVLLFIYAPRWKDKKSETLAVAPFVTDIQETPFAHIEIQYPQSSPTDKKEMFDFVQNAKQDFLDEFEKLSTSTAEDMGIRSGEKYEFNLKTEIATTTDTVSYIIFLYTYTGGAHGGTTVHPFTYNRLGRLLTLSDVFAKPYVETVAPLAYDYFKKKLSTTDEGSYIQDDMLKDGTAPTVENYQTWYLEGDDIVFVFGQYAIGPYVLGIQEFPLAKSTVKKLLTKDMLPKKDDVLIMPAS